MAEKPNPGPDPANPPDPTGDQPAPATDDKGAGNGNPDQPTPSGSNDDDTVTLPKKDYQNLISQRDKNFDKSATAEDQLGELTATVEDLQKQNFIGSWLKDNSKKYPDVTEEDLYSAAEPGDVEAIAKRVQGRVEKIRQDALKSVQTVDSPALSPEDRAEQLKKAEKDHDLEKMIELNTPKSW